VAYLEEARKPSIDPQQVRVPRDQGFGATDIAKHLKIGRASVYRLLGEAAAPSGAAQ